MSLSCRDVGERLLLYRDGSLPAEESEWLRQHLHLCPNCIALLDNYEEVVNVLERLKPVNMPLSALDRIRKHLEQAGGTDECCK